MGGSGVDRGWSAMGLGAGPAHAVHFATYEAVKHRLGGNEPEQMGLFASVVGGACATVRGLYYCPLCPLWGWGFMIESGMGGLDQVTGDAVMVPHDTVKSRLQQEKTPYKNFLDCVSRTYRSEGIRAFFRSYGTTVIMNMPFTAINFASYESAKQVLRSNFSVSDEEGPLIQAVAGGFSGCIASAVTTPLDVAKTRLQATRLYSGTAIGLTLANIAQEEGPGALLRGLRPRVLYHVPAGIICWVTYETGSSSIPSCILL